MPKLQTLNPKATYRPDIDGLRAVAVLLVVFDHLQIRLYGGFVGVDVFFVISGYLISSAILSEMGSGRFSIVSFYERRIRRIFPAMLVMVAGASVLAYRFFVPAEIESYARSMLAALFSVSNFLFWSQSGYFDQPSAIKPLLHTWSLAVEEQFYIFFPIFLVVVRRLAPRRVSAAIWTVFSLSLVLACVWVRRDATTAFFIAPLRAWELLIGTIVSQRYLPAIHGKLQRNAASIIGLVLILGPALRYSARTIFPGANAFAPCLGAALIIAAGETGPSLVGKLLGWRPVVFVGLISYSLYLWHWPILVFQKTSYLLVSAPATEMRVKLTVLAVSLIAGALSWRFVETPFRKGRLRPERGSLFAVNGAAVVLLTVVGAYMISSHGLASRFPPNALQISGYAEFDPKAAFREDVCFLERRTSFSHFKPEICLKEDASRKHYLLLGDSHAAHLYPGLSAVFPEINLSQATVAGCRPFIDPQPNAEVACSAMSRYIHEEYLPHHHMDVVLLAGRWEQTEFAELAKTISSIQGSGARVVLMGPSVEYDLSLPRLLAMSLRDHHEGMVEDHRSVVPQEVDKKLAVIARHEWHVAYISMYEDLCAAQVEMVAKTEPETRSGCPVYAAPGVPLLFDTDHLTPQGSVLYAEAIRSRRQLF